MLVKGPVDIRRMFSDLSGRYDLFNLLASFGLDNLWRKNLCVRVDDGSHVLDLCCGTGDLALETAKLKKNTRITGVDFCQEMLDLARLKTAKMRLGDRIEWVSANAEKLPFEDQIFDYVICSFAFRNLSSQVDTVIFEIRRVLKEGKTALILDLGRPTSPVLKFPHYFYLKYIMPFLGFLVYGERRPFLYLADSILTFYTPEAIKGKFKDAGFRRCAYVSFLSGVAGIYIAEK